MRSQDDFGHETHSPLNLGVKTVAEILSVKIGSNQDKANVRTIACIQRYPTREKTQLRKKIATKTVSSGGERGLTEMISVPVFSEKGVKVQTGYSEKGPGALRVMKAILIWRIRQKHSNESKGTPPRK